MNKRWWILSTLVFVLAATRWAGAQTQLHSHNDYLQPRPLYTAIEAKAQWIEVDVFLVKENLLVGHSLKETSRKKTLQSLYLNPIINLFKKNDGRISPDSNYAPQLVIDIKQDGAIVLDYLLKIFQSYPTVFDRTVNSKAVQIVISGDRGDIANWKNFPSFIQFDGRPFEEYDQVTIQKIAMISDNYYKYLETRTNRGDSIKVREVVRRATVLNKPMRFWAAPDNEQTWKFLIQFGASVINTDKPQACREFLNSVKVN